MKTGLGPTFVSFVAKGKEIIQSQTMTETLKPVQAEEEAPCTSKRVFRKGNQTKLCLEMTMDPRVVEDDDNLKE